MLRMAIRKETDYTRLRSYAALFSRRIFVEIIKYSDFSQLDALRSRFGIEYPYHSYSTFLRSIYRALSKNYRNEYVCKNMLVNWLLAKKFSQPILLANEFRVNGSILDLALFNGESCAFEIKTEYDSPQRLLQQLESYQRLFEKTYLVTPESKLETYRNIIPSQVGLIVLCGQGAKLSIEQEREAEGICRPDPSVMIRSLRTAEYKWIVQTYFGALPPVSTFEMFTECEKQMRNIPSEELNKLFLQALKGRRSVTPNLGRVQKELRQIALAMNLRPPEIDQLKYNLSSPMG